MKVIICSSISAEGKVLEIKKKLESMGHSVEIPYTSEILALKPVILHGDLRKIL